MKKNFLINLDGYLVDSCANALKKIIFQNNNNYALYCTTIADKKKIQFIFKKKIQLYCKEEFFLNNYKNVELKDIIFVEKKIGLKKKECLVAFDQYSKYYLRQFLGKKKKSELDSKRIILNYQFYQKIFINYNPDIILNEHSGGSGSKILFNMCMKENKKLYLFQSVYWPDKFTILDHCNFKTLLSKNLNAKNIKKKDFYNFCNKMKNSLKELAPLESFGHKQIKKKFFTIEKICNFFIRIKNYYNYSADINYLLGRFDPVLDGLAVNYWSKIKNFFFEKFLTDKLDLNKKYFVLFLQVEPEMTVYSFENNKIEIEELINRISKCLPETYYLIVKEHPGQIICSRSRALKFFFKIKKLKNVKISSAKFNSLKLIENSECVITGNGTPAFESMLKNKECIVLGNFFYYDKNRHNKLLRIDDIESLIFKVLKKNMQNSDSKEDKNFIFAFNIYKSMLDGYLYYSKKLATNKFIKINDYNIYKSFKVIFTKMKKNNVNIYNT